MILQWYTTFTSLSNHGLKINNKVRVNTGVSTFRGSFVVTKNVSATQFAARVGTSITTATNVSTGSSSFVFEEGFSSRDGIPTVENESLNGRMVSRYAESQPHFHQISVMLSQPV